MSRMNTIPRTLLVLALGVAFGAATAVPASGSAVQSGVVSGVVLDEIGQPVPGAVITTADGAADAESDESGAYSLEAPSGVQVLVAEAFGFDPETRRIEIPAGGAAEADFVLTEAPHWRLSGVVRDGGEHGWPLFAKVELVGLDRAVYTDPATGRYSVRAPEGRHVLVIQSMTDGHLHEQLIVTVVGDVEADARLDVDGENCVAPGYAAGEDGCEATPGGLLLGHVTADGPDDYLDDATVEDLASGASTTSGPTPSVPGLHDGFYLLFVPGDGPREFEASHPGFVARQETVTVTADAVAHHEFDLG